jgi:hypothetical protein
MQRIGGWAGSAEVLIGAEAPSSGLIGRRAAEVPGEGLRVRALAGDVKGDPVQVLPQGGDQIVEVDDPVPGGVAGVMEDGREGGHGGRDHPVLLVPGLVADLLPTAPEATGVALRGDPFRGLADGAAGVEASAGLLLGVVGLVPDDPDMRPRRGGDEAGAAPGEGFVAVGGGEGAVRIAAVVEDHDHPEARVRPFRIDGSAAAKILGVGPDGLLEDHPAGHACGAEPLPPWARVVDAVKIDWQAPPHHRSLHAGFTSARAFRQATG